MNITKDILDNFRLRINLEIEENDYREKVDQEIKKYRKTASMPGFRAGKIPTGIIVKKYGAAIVAEELNKLLPESLNKYIESENLTVIGNPINHSNEEEPDYTNSKVYRFSFDYLTSPPILTEFGKNTSFDFYKIEVNEDLINKTVEESRMQFPDIIDVTEIGENVRIQTDARQLDEEKKPINEGIVAHATFDLTDIKDETIRQSLIGLKTGDFAYFNPTAAFGNEVETSRILGITNEQAQHIEHEFQFEIVKISQVTPAEINQELFEKTFPGENVTDYQTFTEKIKSILRMSYSKDENQLFLRQVINTLIESIGMDIPDDTIKHWITINLSQKSADTISDEEIVAYRNELTQKLVEKELLNKYPKLKVTLEDIKHEVRNFYRNYFVRDNNYTKELAESIEHLVEDFLKKDEEVNKIYDQLFNQRLINFFKSSFTITEKEISTEEFIKKMREAFALNTLTNQVEHDDDHVHDQESSI